MKLVAVTPGISQWAVITALVNKYGFEQIQLANVAVRNPNLDYVITDVRRQDQANLVANLGGVVWHMYPSELDLLLNHRDLRLTALGTAKQIVQIVARALHSTANLPRRALH